MVARNAAIALGPILLPTTIAVSITHTYACKSTARNHVCGRHQASSGRPSSNPKLGRKRAVRSQPAPLHWSMSSSESRAEARRPVSRLKRADQVVSSHGKSASASTSPGQSRAARTRMVPTRVRRDGCRTRASWLSLSHESRAERNKQHWTAYSPKAIRVAMSGEL
eukprot:scaffold10220_cov144-Isochrysis_galbana.AAC.13